MKNEKLTPSETHDLKTLEAVIERGQKTFLEVGDALAEIRDRRLYQVEFENFEDYCQTKWGWSRQRSNQMISAAAVVDSLPEKLTTMVVNERTARELGKVPEKDRPKVLKAAAAAGPVNEATVRDFSSAYTSAPVTPKTEPKPTPPPAPVIELDKEGYPIPAEVLPLWNRALAEGKEICQMFANLKNIIHAAREEKDMAYAELKSSMQSAIIDLGSMRGAFKGVIPYSVCHWCNGTAARKKCQNCHGRGFYSELFFKQHVPSELKELREKASKKK